MPAVCSPVDPRLSAGPDRDEVTEVSLLLPAAQLAELERLARRDGLTVAQLLRRQVRDLLTAAAARAPDPAPPTPSQSTLHIGAAADVFKSGDDVLVVEADGPLKEVRQAKKGGAGSKGGAKK